MTRIGYFDFEKLSIIAYLLGVELQFYMLWSLIFFWAFFKKNLKLIISFLFILSIILSILYSHRNETFFYFTGLRIFEFCIGSYIFFFKNKIYRNDFLLFLSLLVIISCPFIFDENLSYSCIISPV